MINCPYCGKLTDPKLESCPHCGGFTQQGAVLPGAPPPVRAAHQSCPNCRALVKEGDIICVACGTNLLTGQKIADEQRQQRAASTSGRRPLLWALIGLAIVAIVAAAGAGAYVLMRDPVQSAIKLVKANNPHEAAVVLGKYLEKRPDNARGQFVLGQVYWKMNQYQQASAAFDKASEADPHDVKAAMLAVLLSQMAGGEHARERQIARLRNVARDAGNGDVYGLLALMLAVANDANGQAAAFEKAAELGKPMLDVKGISTALLGKPEEAQVELTKAAETEGEGGDMAAALGFVACMAGKTDEAERRLKQALESNTSIKGMVQARLGILLAARGAFEDAEPHLRDAVAADKNDTTAQFFRAVCLLARNQTLEATREFEAIAQTQSPYATEATVRAAEVHLRQNEVQVARDLIERAITNGSATAPVYTLRGRAMVANNEDDKARDAFKKAIAADGGYAPAFLESGLLYVKQQMFYEGIQDLEKYLSLVPPDAPGTRAPEVKMLVDQLRQATGRTDSAPADNGANGRVPGRSE